MNRTPSLTSCVYTEKYKRRMRGWIIPHTHMNTMIACGVHNCLFAAACARARKSLLVGLPLYITSLLYATHTQRQTHTLFYNAFWKMSHALYSKYLHVRARISKINWLAYFFFAISKIGTYLLNTHFYYLLFFFWFCLEKYIFDNTAGYTRIFRRWHLYRR